MASGVFVRLDLIESPKLTKLRRKRLAKQEKLQEIKEPNSIFMVETVELEIAIAMEKTRFRRRVSVLGTSKF